MKFKFSGKSPRSALSDLSIWQFDGMFKKVANVELKAHNPAQDSIDKDIEKLVREKITGNWFHTLKNINNRTIRVVFDKFKTSLKRFNSEDILCPIVFCFCVLDLKWAMIKVFDPAGQPLDKYVDRFFQFDYSIERDQIFIKSGDENGWMTIDQNYKP